MMIDYIQANYIRDALMSELCSKLIEARLTSAKP